MLPLLSLAGGAYAFFSTRNAAATVNIPVIGPVDKKTVRNVGIAAAVIGGYMLVKHTDVLKGITG